MVTEQTLETLNRYMAVYQKELDERINSKVAYQQPDPLGCVSVSVAEISEEHAFKEQERDSFSPVNLEHVCFRIRDKHIPLPLLQRKELLGYAWAIRASSSYEEFKKAIAVFTEAHLAILETQLGFTHKEDNLHGEFYLRYQYKNEPFLKEVEHLAAYELTVYSSVVKQVPVVKEN